MNREQAEHLLNAYVKAKDKDAKDTLKTVILDEMTNIRYYPYYPYRYPSPYYPTITWTDKTEGTNISWTNEDSSGQGVTTISNNGGE